MAGRYGPAIGMLDDEEEEDYKPFASRNMPSIDPFSRQCGCLIDNAMAKVNGFPSWERHSYNNSLDLEETTERWRRRVKDSEGDLDYVKVNSSERTEEIQIVLWQESQMLNNKLTNELSQCFRRMTVAIDNNSRENKSAISDISAVLWNIQQKVHHKKRPKHSDEMAAALLFYSAQVKIAQNKLKLWLAHLELRGAEFPSQGVPRYMGSLLADHTSSLQVLVREYHGALKRRFCIHTAHLKTYILQYPSHGVNMVLDKGKKNFKSDGPAVYSLVRMVKEALMHLVKLSDMGGHPANWLPRSVTLLYDVTKLKVGKLVSADLHILDKWIDISNNLNKSGEMIAAEVSYKESGNNTDHLQRLCEALVEQQGEAAHMYVNTHMDDLPDDLDTAVGEFNKCLVAFKEMSKQTRTPTDYWA